MLKVFLLVVLILNSSLSCAFAVPKLELTPEARAWFSSTSGEKYLQWGTYRGL